MPTTPSRLVADARWAATSQRYGFADAADVAVNSLGEIHVVTRDSSPVIVLAETGELLRRWPHGIVGGIHGITIDAADRVLLTDHVDHVVRIFDRDGAQISTLGLPGEPSDTGYCPGCSPVRRAAGPFNAPTNVAVDHDGSIVVADGYGNARVHRFDAGGTLLDSWGTPGSGPGQFNLPHGIALTADRRILVADRENSRVHVFDPGGEPLDEWTAVNRPSDLVVTSDDIVVIAELKVIERTRPTPHQRYAATTRPGLSGAARLTWCRSDGTVLGRVGTHDTFISPHGIGLGPDGSVYVAELCATVAARDGVTRQHPALHRFRWEPSEAVHGDVDHGPTVSGTR